MHAVLLCTYRTGTPRYSTYHSTQMTDLVVGGDLFVCVRVCVGPDFDGSKMDHNVLLSLPLSLLRSQKGAIAALACREIGGEGTERKDGAVVEKTNPHAALSFLAFTSHPLLPAKREGEEVVHPHTYIRIPTASLMRPEPTGSPSFGRNSPKKDKTRP